MKIYLKGNYNNNFIRLSVLKANRSTPYVLLNVHGLYGISGDNRSKSRLLGKVVLAEGFANVVHFSSSRDWNIYDSSNRELSLQAFKDKSFKQERQDLIDAIDLLNVEKRELFGVNHIRLIVVANSMGGTIISSISEKFKLIDKIVLCGSGTGASSSTKPILSTYPSKEYIKMATTKYKGEVMLLQGDEDDVVPLYSQNELIASYDNAKINKKRVIHGANHNFSSIRGKNKRLAYKLYCEEIVNFIKE